MIEAGAHFPSFELPDQDRQPVGSASLEGSWVLLYWYPKADTPGCTAQAQGLRDQIEAFDDLGCVVLGASFDEPEANRAFRERYGLPFRLVSDRERALAMAVGAAADVETGYARRVAHLIDPDGVVAAVYDVEDPEFFAELVLDDLEAAQGV